jgi:hypothetical protein
MVPYVMAMVLVESELKTAINQLLLSISIKLSISESFDDMGYTV